MITRVLSIRDLTQSVYVLRVERGNLDFEPGQYISLGRPGSLSRREYTVYSSPADPYVEVLVKVIPGGLVSGLLRVSSPGDRLEMEGPFGKFRIPPEARSGRPLLFVATGTGVSPFHCFALSYPSIEYRLIHGVRALEDRYDHETFPADRYVACVSRQSGGDWDGRVTDWITHHGLAAGALCYLCGGSDMIYEVIAQLTALGVPRERMFAEIYF